MSHQTQLLCNTKASITKTRTTNNAYSFGSGTSFKTVKVTDYIMVNSDGIGNTIQDVTSLK